MRKLRSTEQTSGVHSEEAAENLGPLFQRMPSSHVSCFSVVLGEGKKRKEDFQGLILI